ncbi:hypothetical protein MMC17_005329 [Xylographa soralifera]|nr:hypothetical protein [Xylographa soralifera]
MSDGQPPASPRPAKKVRLSDDESPASPRPAKKVRLSDDADRTITSRLYRRFVHQHGLQLSQKRFLGLCAYLCALLRWGCHFAADDLDEFIVGYPGYESCLPRLEREQMSVTKLRMPSYHQWLRDRGGPRTADGGPRILTGARLRGIWEEHPYTFLHTEMSMEAVRGHDSRTVG